MSDSFWLRVLRFLPRNLISRAFGRVASMRRPRWFVRRFKGWFARRFDIDLTEAARPLDDYASLLEFFTRTLKEGVRPIDSGDDVLVSPVDAAVGAFGRIESGRLFQAKGMAYTAEALLGDADTAAAFESGHYATFYLSPRDYHRIHSPADGKVVSTFYEPGTLWPVNPPAVARIPRLFAVNERVTTLLETAHGRIAVVMVGATNVGSIRLAYEDFVTNRVAPGRHWRHRDLAIARGAHLGTFELGSTVVLLVENDRFAWSDLAEGRWIAMGATSGRFASSE